MLFEIVFQFATDPMPYIEGCDLMLFEIVFQFNPSIHLVLFVVI